MRIMTVGHACMDIVHWVPTPLTAEAKTDSRDMRIQIGGSAANVAAALRKLGADATLCAVLGSNRDPLTGMLLASLENRGIDLDCMHVDDVPCPNTIVAVTDNGENALASFQPDAVVYGTHIPGSMEGISMVMGDTYRPRMVREVFAMAKGLGIPTVLDVDKSVSDYTDLPTADYVWFSQEAWQSIDNDKRGLAMAQRHFGGCIGTTNGPNAVIWINQDGTIDEFNPTMVQAQSTLGAGDVFRAALAISLCQGHDLGMAVPIACASAGQHVAGKALSRLTR